MVRNTKTQRLDGSAAEAPTGRAPICSSCGANLAAGDRFCPDCGTAAIGAEPSSPPDSTEKVDRWKIATLGLIGVFVSALVCAVCSFSGQSTRMSHGEVVAHEHKLVTVAIQQRANQDATSEKQAIALAVRKQKTHDQQVAKGEAEHAKSEGESSGRSQGESSGKAQGESSGKTQGETAGRAQAQSETTKINGHDSEGYAYGTLPNGRPCDDNPEVTLPACS